MNHLQAQTLKELKGMPPELARVCVCVCAQECSGIQGRGPTLTLRQPSNIFAINI